MSILDRDLVHPRGRIDQSLFLVFLLHNEPVVSIWSVTRLQSAISQAIPKHFIDNFLQSLWNCKSWCLPWLVVHSVDLHWWCNLLPDVSHFRSVPCQSHFPVLKAYKQHLSLSRSQLFSNLNGLHPLFCQPCSRWD